MFILHTDGGSRGNPGPSAIGCILFNEDGIEVARASERVDDTTNNVAEYQGLLKGIALAKQNAVKDLAVHMDSELIIKQLQGEYKVKAAHLLPLFTAVQGELTAFRRVTFTHVPRENKRQAVADMLVNWALDR